MIFFNIANYLNFSHVKLFYSKTTSKTTLFVLTCHKSNTGSGDSRVCHKAIQSLWVIQLTFDW